jgi:hypothetical protein
MALLVQPQVEPLLLSLQYHCWKNPMILRRLQLRFVQADLLVEEDYVSPLFLQFLV